MIQEDGEIELSQNTEIARAIAEAIVKAAQLANRNANDYSRTTIKNTKISGNQILQNSLPGFMIQDGTIPVGKVHELSAEIARIALAEIEAAEIDFAQIKNVVINNAHISNAGIDYAKIKDLDAASAYFGSQIFELGLGDELYIGRLRVSTANIAHLEVGELILEDDNGDLYKIGVDNDGNVVTTLYEVQYQNISSTTKSLMSQYTIYRGTSAPSTPYVGQLWVNTSTDIIHRCVAVTPAVVWEPVKSSELHTSYVNAVETGLEILSTGKIDIKNGGNININSGGNLNVDAMGNINISSGGKINVTAVDAIKIGASSNLADYIDNEINVETGKKSAIYRGTYNQMVAKTGMKIGDIWVVTDKNNREYQAIAESAGASSWVMISAGKFTGASVDIDADSGSVNIAAGKKVTVASGGTLELAGNNSVTIGTGGDLNMVGSDINIDANSKINLSASDSVILSSGDGLDTVIGDIETRVSDAELEITDDSIMQKVSTHTTYTTRQTAIDNGISGAQSTANNAATAASNAQTTANNAATSATTANSLLSDIASDSKLTPVEKLSIKKEWDIIASEKSKIDTEAGKFNVSVTAYTASYNTLNSYLNNTTDGLLKDLTTTSSIVSATFRNNFKAYYDARQDVLNGITTKAKSLADNAQTTANNASSAASTAQATANSRNRTYLSTSQPSSPVVGDLWINPNANSEVRRWDGSNWELAQDTRIASTANTVSTTLNSTGIYNLVSQSTGYVNDLGDKASVQSVSTLNTTVGNINAAVTTIQGGVTNKSMLEMADDRAAIAVSSVHVGGTNMVPYSNSLTDMTKWRDWGDQATFTQVYDVVQLTRPVGSATPIAIVSRENIRFVTGVQYMLSFNYAPYYTDSVPINWVQIVSNSGNVGLPWGDIVDLGLSTDKYSPTNYIQRKALLFTVPRNIDDGKIMVGCNPPNPATHAEGFRISKIKIEQGNKVTPWSPHPADPASGVKTASVTIGDGGIDLTASDKITINGGEFIATRANSITNEATTSIVSTVKSDSDWLGKGEAANTYSTIQQTNNSINLAVGGIQVGGRNLVWKTAGDEGSAGRAVWSSSGLMKFAVESTYMLNGCKPTRIFGTTGSYVFLHNSGLSNHPFVMGEEYTLSFYTYNLTSVTASIRDSTSANLVINFGTITPKWTKSMLTSNGTLYLNYFEVTGTVTGTQNMPVVYFSASAVDEYTRYYCVKLERGNKATAWSPAPEDPASGVKTSHITVESDLIDIGTGGNVQIAAGATLSMEAGTVQIESADASASFLQFGDAFYVGKEGNQYQLNINSRAEDAIQINNKSVWHKGNIVVQQNPPASGKQIIWLKPNATTSAEYKTTITTTANLHYSHPVNSRSFNLAAQSSDTLSATGTYNFAVTIQFKRYGGDGSGTYDTTGGTVVLTKGGATLSMNLPAMVFGSWKSKTINLTGSTTSTAFTATTGYIACAITITGVKPYTSSDFIAHVKPSDIRCVITGPGGSTAQPCQVFFVP